MILKRIIKKIIMNEKNKKQISKFLSLILRHRPEKIGLTLDKNGWATVSELIAKSKLRFTIEDLEVVVATCDKQRFIFNETKSMIRANQGHSLKNIDLELQNNAPPEYLYHGTVNKFMSAIKEKGLLKMNRQHVHLSKDRETALKVGNRRGQAIILSVRSNKMHQDGYEFYKSENGVWLTDNVPTAYIEFKN